MAKVKEKSIYKKNVIWNAVAGIINAGEAIVILAVASRINGLKDAGVLTLAFSLANLFMTIGKFGIKNYQVAHDGEDFSFRTFLISRVITVALMVLIAFLYVAYYFIYDQYTIEKSSVIFFVCMWYAIEAFEDVFFGKYQALGRLDIGSKMFSIRWIITIVTFIIIDLIYENIVFATICTLGVELLWGAVAIIYISQKYKFDKMQCAKGDRGLKNLFRESKFLCISAFLYYFVTNIPKYVINAYLGDEVQAIYGYISMPIFVISLLNSFVYQPQLTAYVFEWRENKIKQFVNRIFRQLLIIVSIMVTCIFGAYVLGIPILSILYHEKLDMYKMHLIILLLGGGFLAVGGFLANMLTIINEQKKSMVVYAIVALMGYVTVDLLVKDFRLIGAVWGYTVTMALMALLFGGVFAYIIREKNYRL